MLEITTHNFLFFTRKEFWFYDGEKITEGTYNTFSAAKKINEGNITYLQKYQTTQIDLSKTEEDLFKAIHPTFRYDIRTAEKQNFKYISFDQPTNNDCKMLIESYNSFARSKNLKSYNRRWITALKKAGKLYFTKILLGNIILITHVYVFDNETILLSNSFHNPEFTNDRIRSEANKLLHWKDVLLFKSRNFKTYDFGGINPEKLPGVSKFKLNFGGEVTERYRYIKTSPLFLKFVTLYKTLIKE